LKQGLNSSATKSYPNQLVVPRASLEALRLPNYFWIVTILLALALLATAAIYRERERLRVAQTSYQFTQQKVQAATLNNALLRRDFEAMKHDKNTIAQEAQTNLNYLRPNEVIVVLR
jgi:cell division protein FtsB